MSVTASITNYLRQLRGRPMAEHISINKSAAVSSAIELLKLGKIIAVPTDTIYGLACDATNTKAINKLFNIKCRDKNKPVAICLSEISEVQLWANTNNIPQGLLNNLLPGSVTLILSGINKLDSSLCSNGKIGIRIPDYNFIRNVARGLKKPLALTSANLSGETSALNPLEFKEIWDKVSAIFDGGTTNTNRSGSTIIDLSEAGMYYILRDGVSYSETVDILKRFGLKGKVNKLY